MLTEIKTNVEKLIEALEGLRADNKALVAKLEQSAAVVEDQKKQITELEKQIDNLKLTSAFVGGVEQKEIAKQRIDKMIRDINRCISLLEG